MSVRVLYLGDWQLAAAEARTRPQFRFPFLSRLPVQSGSLVYLPLEVCPDTTGYLGMRNPRSWTTAFLIILQRCPYPVPP